MSKSPLNETSCCHHSGMGVSRQADAEGEQQFPNERKKNGRQNKV